MCEVTQPINRLNFLIVARQLLNYKLPISGLTLVTDKGTHVAISFREGGYANNWLISIGDKPPRRNVVIRFGGSLSDMMKTAYSLTKEPIFNELGDKIEELGDMCL